VDRNYLFKKKKLLISEMKEQTLDRLSANKYIVKYCVLFTIAKLWKQPRCPTTDEWIKKMWYLYTMEFYSAMKKSEILSFAGK
jgi:hypothetical protein